MTVTYEIKQDEYCDESPRDWDNLGTMVCWHSRYDLGDVQHKDHGGIPTDERVLMYNLRLYEHGSLSITADPIRALQYPFTCPWDSGYVGFIYVRYSDVLKEFGRKKMSHKLAKQVGKILISETEVYNQYLSGDVWGYIVKDDDGEILDSCWGFYGYDYCEEEAKSVVKYYQDRRSEELITLQSVVR